MVNPSGFAAESFHPLWNTVIDGFGNKDPGRGRTAQRKSPWDVLHPGRRFAEKLADGKSDASFLTEEIEKYLAR